MKSVFKLAIALLLIGNTAMAQNNKLNGVVMEETAKGDLVPLPGANILWEKANVGTTTNQDGYFEIDFYKEDRLIVSFIGFETDTLVITSPHKTNLIMKANRTQTGEVEVVGRQKSTTISTIAPINVETINQKELRKAACCNLSESFETNPSVDVSYTDAVTGRRQIQLLGLNGKYTQIQAENIPLARGMASSSGLTFIPGPWVESIQLTKGIGSVVNGYESITGQINVELYKPHADGDKLMVNGYANSTGRIESNLVTKYKLGKHWTGNVLLHGSMRNTEIDNNDDSFIDAPLGHQVNLMKRFKYDSHKGFEAQVGFRILNDRKEGGQFGNSGIAENNRYQILLDDTRAEVFAKAGYVFEDKVYRSIGLIVSGSSQSQDVKIGPNNTTTFTNNQKHDAFYANLIFQDIIGDTRHKYRTGLSLQIDNYYSLPINFTTIEAKTNTPGAFIEYTYSPHEAFNIVAGLRGDLFDINETYSLANADGFTVVDEQKGVIIPRVHIRYALNENNIFRLSGGRGVRRPFYIADNISLLASNLNVTVRDNILLEDAWNFGGGYTLIFKMNYRPVTIVTEAFRTQFTKQLAIDFDNVNGYTFFETDESYANTLQVQADYSPMRRFDVRVAYRFQDVKVKQIDGSLRQKAFTSRHRAFANLAYETKNDWKFDYTINWIGEQRAPRNGEVFKRSPDFVTMNAQIAKDFGKKWNAYVGVENITNFRQDNPIVSANNTSAPNFDTNRVWGPIVGRLVYAGFYFRIP